VSSISINKIENDNECVSKLSAARSVFYQRLSASDFDNFHVHIIADSIGQEKSLDRN